MSRIFDKYGIRQRTPETKRRLLALMDCEYGPNATGALSVTTATFFATIIDIVQHTTRTVDTLIKKSNNATDNETKIGPKYLT